MNGKITQKIKLWGIVQGVGFRPFVAKVANRMCMKGQVLNIGGLVDIIVTDTPQRIDEFVETIKKEKPAPAEIVHIRRDMQAYREFSDFTILASDDGDDEAAMIPADLAMCPTCLDEMLDFNNPRFMHPFISCMVCGPRYTIIDKIPYDRQNTAMIDYPMCSLCGKEYRTLKDRRFHAQTISCHDCGPMIAYKLNNNIPAPAFEAKISWGREPSEKENQIARQVWNPLYTARNLLFKGHVIALKGIGGYNLVCDPTKAEAVMSLRNIKKREQKPFAVMFRDMNWVKQFCRVSETEEKLLTSSARPIILLEKKPPDSYEPLMQPPVKEFEKSRFIGAFLPSAGYQYMLLDIYKKPLIVTSANLSDMPIIKDDTEMFMMMEKYHQIAGVFYNERSIRVRVDDSVVRVIDEQPQMIRRSKGYVPVPLYINAGNDVRPMVLATGGQLKNSFALSKGPFSYMSQYFGDLDSRENQVIYGENVERMKTLFRIEPEYIACDLHPLYYTTRFAKNYAAHHKNIKKIIPVQHHHAHVASVIAEHNITKPVIGVSFDGTGYGTDGAVWGGEIMLCHGAYFERLTHLKYIDMIGGDSSMKEAWKSAMCYLHAMDHGISMSGGADEFVIDISYIAEKSPLRRRREWEYVSGALENNINVIKSSSMGRLFDAAAALIGIKDYNDYEGQCAIMLEDAAARAAVSPGADYKDDMALRFHKQVADTILRQCIAVRAGKTAQGIGSNVNIVALTGGVFQNRILMESTLELLRNEGFEVYYNVSVSPNDGGIALGQNYIAMQMLGKQGRL